MGMSPREIEEIYNHDRIVELQGELDHKQRELIMQIKMTEGLAAQKKELEVAHKAEYEAFLAERERAEKEHACRVAAEALAQEEKAWREQAEELVEIWHIRYVAQKQAADSAEADNERLRKALVTIQATTPGSAHRIAIQALGEKD
jgi:peptidoglycan hydrolase CwlO-like protein